MFLLYRFAANAVFQTATKTCSPQNATPGTANTTAYHSFLGRIQCKHGGLATPLSIYVLKKRVVMESFA